MLGTSSLASSLASRPEAERKEILASLSDDQVEELLNDWRFWARPPQIAPDGDWSTWIALAGRGFGKTEAGAQWIRERERDGARDIALVAETQKDLEEVMVPRLLSIYPDDERPKVRYKPVRITWPSGAVALGYNGTEPDQLRGPEFDTAWVDELAKYRYARETWDMLQFTMRRGEDPRVLVTTTPRPIPVIREILEDPSTVISTGSTFDNAENLPKKFLDRLRKRYEGTRLGRQELYAEVLDDVPGALWTEDAIERVKDEPDLIRVVVAVDPSGSSGSEEEGADEIGIVVAGKRADGGYHVLEDVSAILSPQGWGEAAVSRYRAHAASVIVAERNFGGAMVEAVIRGANPTVNVKLVTASRGKAVRAEPIAALYEQGRVTHAEGLDRLEDQLLKMTTSGYTGDGSPDRMDALVWALTELSDMGTGPVFPTSWEAVVTPPFAIPAFWRRAYGFDLAGNAAGAVWLAEDPTDRTLYAYAEYQNDDGLPVVHANAIKARGDWIKGSLRPHGATEAEVVSIAQAFQGAGMKLSLAPTSVEAGVGEVWSMLETGRLRLFSTLAKLQAEYLLYRRDEHGKAVKENDRLMTALRHGVATFNQIARQKPVETADRGSFRAADTSAGY